MATLPPITEEEMSEVKATNVSSGNPQLDAARERAIAYQMKDVEELEAQKQEWAKTPEGREKLAWLERGPSPTEPRSESSVAARKKSYSSAVQPQQETIKITPELFSELYRADPPDISNEYVMKSAVIDSFMEGKPLAQAVFDSYQKSEKDFARNVAQGSADSVGRELSSEYRRMAEETDLSQPVEEVFTDLEVLKDLEVEAAQPQDIDFRALGFTVSPEIGQEMVERLAVKAKVARMQQQVLDEMGFTDWVINVGGWFIPGKQLKDNFDVSGSMFSGEEWAQSFVNNWQALSPQEQEAYLPELFEMLSEELPEQRVAQMLGALTKANPAEAIEEFNLFWAAVDTAEIGAIGWKILHAGAKAVNKARTISRMAELGDKTEAGETIAVAIASKSDEAAAVIGMDKVSAANTASKLATSDIDPVSIDGLSKEVTDSLDSFRKSNRQVLEEVKQGNLFIKENFLSKAERERVEESLVGRMSSQDDIENVRIIPEESSDEFVTIEYERVDLETGESLGVERQRYDFELDDAGAWKIDKVGLMSSYVNSPTVWARFGDFRQEVDTAMRLDSASAKVYNELVRLHREAAAPILGTGWKSIKAFTPSAREKMARIDKVLLQGDRDQVVYSVDELRSGQVAGIALKDDEIETYYRVRELTDTFLELRDIAKRRDYQVRGLKSLIIDGVDANLFAKPLARLQDATNSINQTGRKYFYDADTGEVFKFDDLDLKEWYDQGYVLSRLSDPHKFKGTGTEVYYALVRNEQVHELPMDIIPKRTGYIPKLNTKAVYFVKEFNARNLDGVAVSASDTRAASRTVRMFDDKDEAEQFALEQEMLARQEGKSPDEVIYRALGDRELEQFRTVSGADETYGLGSGGLFTGARGDDDILFGLDGVEMPRADAFTSLSTNIASLSRYLPRNEWRLGLERKAVNTANALVASGNQRFKSFDELANAPLDKDSGTIIRALHRQISDWNNVPSTSELVYRHAVQKVIESSLGKKLKKVGGSDALHNLRSTDPVAAARAAAFHGMLGWFNPVQLWVQAQGAAVSLSMSLTDPAQMGRVMQNQFALQALQYVNKTDRNLERVAKSLGMDVEELRGLKAAWDKSGLHDGVLTTPDHAAAARGYGIGMDSLKRTADAGLFFYKGGELFNRRVAFTTAYQEWRKANKGAELTDEVLKSLLNRSNNLMLNMTKAARSSYQKGLLSLPTQFMSINHRTIESLLGLNGNFTMAERRKLIAGQVALYGSAGIPLGGMLAQETAALLGYDTQEKIEKNMTPEMRKTINEGLVGFLTLAMFGADIDVSDRSSLIGSMDDFVDEALFGDGTLLENITGAFGTQGGRFWTSMAGTWAPLSLGIAENRAIDTAKLALNPLIGSITTFRNIDKALFMRNYHRIIDKNNKDVLVKDFSLVEEMATAIGFRLSDEVEVYEIEKLKRLKTEYRKAVVDQLAIWYRRAAIEEANGSMTDEQRQYYAEAVAALYQSFDNPSDLRKVKESLREKLKDRSNRENDAWLGFRRDFSDGAVSTLFNIRSAFTNPGIVQEGGFEGQEVLNDGE